ncbi:hypothetical protein Dda_1332 [Drechslerella dactyloides]|uniref:Acyltransferase MbtK/IucB-like conserved domain-containing protein n=1 Tax=Drechslerella dactyloides TaxID=74499 RepID=A0AAD6J1T8_DREDA|nr:hypothetical protein Dda_1332 [Drechslerella dactyloides]
MEFDVLYLPTDPPIASFVKLESSPPSGEASQTPTTMVTIRGDPSLGLQETVSAVLEGAQTGSRLRVPLGGDAGSGSAELACERIWIALYWCFHFTSNQHIAVPKGKPVPERCVELVLESDDSTACATASTHLERLGLVDIDSREDGTRAYIVFATTFWQTSLELFISRLNPHRYLPVKPLRYTLSNGTIRHPKRPLPPQSKTPFYTRHCISDKVNSIFRLRPVDMSDLDLIHNWMNNPRVAEFWGEQGPIEHQKQFLEKCLASKHSFTAIGSWNDLDDQGRLTGWRDACFFDIYWVKEDHLARYANNVQDWDRGVHLLVGEEWARGRSRAWLDSIIHYMFLADPRTQSLYLEPRFDNDLLIKLLMRHGFYKVKDFAFPHKQAAMMKLDRDCWKGCYQTSA